MVVEAHLSPASGRSRPTGSVGSCTDLLHDRYEECLDTLRAERMAFEVTFHHTDSDGTEWMYHVSLYGEGTSGLDVSNPVDQEHQVCAMRCKERGWKELRPVLMLAPRPIRPPAGEAGRAAANSTRSDR